METSVRPIPDVPALLVRPSGSPAFVVVADVHLGLGGGVGRAEGPPEASGASMAAELRAIVRGEGVRRLLIAGDVKHPIVGTPRALRPVVFDVFSTLLADGLEVAVVLGNHDVGLAPYLPREVEVLPAAGVVHGGVGVFHGHRWPAPAVLEAEILVAGHLHPGYRFAPTPEHPDGKRRCWVRVEFPPHPRSAAPHRRRERPEIRAREMVVLPAFNPIAGAEALNRDRPARGRSFLYARFLARGTSRAYLLDGTDLGGIPTPPSPRGRGRGAPRAPTGR